MATFVISQRQNGDYKYELTSRKGKTIFTSLSYELRFECEEHIVLLKKSLETLFFMRFRSTKGKFYFKIILENKEIAISRKYSTQLLVQKGIDEILKYAIDAEVLDFSNQFDFFANNS